MTTAARHADVEMIDQHIRIKNAEYRIALEEKAKRYGYTDQTTGTRVLSEDYYIKAPKDWDDTTMGEWAHSEKSDNLAADDDIPPPPPLHRAERNDKIDGFNKYYANMFKELVNSRNHIHKLISNDEDIKRAMAILHEISNQTGKHPMGKSEITKNILDFVAPNKVGYSGLIKPKRKTRRAKSV